MSITENPFSFCDTANDIEGIAKVLRDAPHIFFDCEGHNLGAEGGSLSLLSFRANSTTFLVDAKSLSKEELRPILDVLESSSHQKVMFDGRMDFSELRHGMGVSLRGIVDLQVADISSRSIRGENLDDQIKRLRPYLSYGELAAQRALYTMVHKLNGLEGCMKEHGVEGKKGDAGNHQGWLQRPLANRQLEYAAQDVELIEKLFLSFESKGYITSELPAQSQRYAEIWIASRPSTEARHPLLPLNIIDQYTTGSFLVCSSCRRSLPAACFSKNAARLQPKCNCYVCRAVKIRNQADMQRQQAWEEQLERGYYESDDEYGSY